MSNKQLIPALRFKGFTAPWEQCELVDCFCERQERSNIGELISVTTNYGIKKFSDLNRHNNSSDDKSKYKCVEIGDIAYNSMRMWQGASGYSFYKGIVSPAYTVLEPKSNISSLFFAYAFKRPSMIHLFKINSQGITSDTWNLKYPAFSKINVFTTIFDEQERISKLLFKLDSVITLHQRKLEKLKNLKKAMLEKMFPKNGSSIPDIRFSGFTDAWEQCDFNNFFDIDIPTNSLSRDKLTFINSKIQNIHYGDILTKYNSILNIKIDNAPYLIDDDISKYKHQLLKNGDIVIADTAEDETAGKVVEVADLYDKKLVAGLHTYAYRTTRNLGLYFLGYYLNSNAYHNQILHLLQGTKVLSISKKNLLSTILIIPRNIIEQKKIGQYFYKLDNLITLHQRKLEKLKNIKKSLLEKMFV